MTHQDFNAESRQLIRRMKAHLDAADQAFELVCDCESELQYRRKSGGSILTIPGTDRSIRVTLADQRKEMKRALGMYGIYERELSSLYQRYNESITVTAKPVAA